MTSIVESRSGIYHDSVSLMHVSRRVSLVKGVDAALVAMATRLNLDLLAEMGFAVPDGARPDDLVVAVRAADESSLADAKAELDRALVQTTTVRDGSAEQVPTRTIQSGARRVTATIGLISVPGAHAFVEALDALESGLNVMIFSDNVPVEQEVILKDEARRRGLLVMGPDCGTARVRGLGLGFANAVGSGPVGIVAASGSGAQQLCCLLDHAGAGVSHVLGVGGRDLSAAVAARSTFQALEALDADRATELIVLVSKTPDSAVAASVQEAVKALSTPVVMGLVGPGHPDLSEVATEVARRIGRARPAWFHLDASAADVPRPGALWGLFVGGTLCQEARAIAVPLLGAVGTELPVHSSPASDGGGRSSGHVMVDFGDDRLTRGRPHPMIDPSLRIAALLRAGTDPGCAVVLLDVVLGYGAEPDPAAALGPAIRRARSVASAGGRELAVVVSLCGSTGDVQGYVRQAAELHDAGASVHLSNAEAARAAVALAKGP